MIIITVFPELGIGRPPFGVLTVAAGSVGTIVAGTIVYYLGKDPGALACSLRDVYYLVAFIFICTVGFGVLGAMEADVEYWALVYQIRAVALVLEVYALLRFFKIWRKGQESN